MDNLGQTLRLGWVVGSADCSRGACGSPATGCRATTPAGPEGKDVEPSCGDAPGLVLLCTKPGASREGGSASAGAQAAAGEAANSANVMTRRTRSGGTSGGQYQCRHRAF